MKPSQIITATTALAKAKQPTMIWGAPGVGKSKVVEQVAKSFGKFIDLRLPLMDPTGADFRFPLVDQKSKEVHWITSADFPKTGSGILFLDELPQATPNIQAAASQLILDRRIGTEYKLPDGWAIVAAGNRETDRAATNRMPSHIANRFTHLEFEVSHDDWYEWAYDNDINPMVVAFLQFKPDLLHKFDPKLRAFPTPRSWEFVSNILKSGGVDDCMLEVVGGTVGEGAAIDFMSFVRVFRSLPDYETILKRPEGCAIPQDVAVKYAVAQMLAVRTEPGDMKQVMKYVCRLPSEFQIIITQAMTKQNKQLAETSAYIGWISQNKELLLNSTVR